MLRSKFKIFQLLAVIFGCLIFISIPYIITHGSKPVKGASWLYISPLLTILFFYFYFRNISYFNFHKESLTVRYFFRKKEYRWSSVKDIYLSTKQRFMLQGMEATSIFFDNGDRLDIWEEVYRNGREMRSFISQKAEDKIRDPKPKISSDSLQMIHYRRYSGNVFNSSGTLVLIGVTIFILVAFKGNSSFQLGAMLTFLFLLYLASGTTMYYFLIDEGSLIIRNHFFPWIRKEIKLVDILEADIETRNTSLDMLRIMTTDFNKKIYAADS